MEICDGGLVSFATLTKLRVLLSKDPANSKVMMP